MKKNKKDLKKYLLENYVDEFGNLDLSSLDFSDFDGNVDISGMQVNCILYQHNQNVGENLFQHGQVVKGNLFQSGSHVTGNLFQSSQVVEGNLEQFRQTVKGSITTKTPKVKYIKG